MNVTEGKQEIKNILDLKLIHRFIMKSRNIQVTIHTKPIAPGDAKSRKKLSSEDKNQTMNCKSKTSRGALQSPKQHTNTMKLGMVLQTVNITKILIMAS